MTQKTSPVVLLLVLCGCAAGAPEVQVGEVPASPTPPPKAEASREAMVRPARDATPSMTEVLTERGIPDRVDNEGKATIWIYDGSEGTEYLSFVKGQLRDHQQVAREP